MDRNQGSQVGMRWWDQVGIDLEEARKTAAAVAEADEDELEE